MSHYLSKVDALLGKAKRFTENKIREDRRANGKLVECIICREEVPRVCAHYESVRYHYDGYVCDNCKSTNREVTAYDS